MCLYIIIKNIYDNKNGGRYPPFNNKNKKSEPYDPLLFCVNNNVYFTTTFTI